MPNYLLVVFLFLLSTSMLRAESNLLSEIYDIETDTITTKPDSLQFEKRNIYTVVEQMPSFPGGEIAMMKYVRDSLKIPPIEIANGIQGRFAARFVVNEDGSISDVAIFREQTPASDEAFVNLIKSIPRWISGKYEGKNVAVYYKLSMYICYR